MAGKRSANFARAAVRSRRTWTPADRKYGTRITRFGPLLDAAGAALLDARLGQFQKRRLDDRPAARPQAGGDVQQIGVGLLLPAAVSDEQQGRFHKASPWPSLVWLLVRGEQGLPPIYFHIVDRWTIPNRREEEHVPAHRRPSLAEVAAAEGKTLPDIIAPDLKVLLCGINPGLYTAAIGHHFGRPGNRFWPALYASGFTDRLLCPYEGARVAAAGYGITNLVARASARADDLTEEELGRGREVLERKVARYRPSSSPSWESRRIARRSRGRARCSAFKRRCWRRQRSGCCPVPAA